MMTKIDKVALRKQITELKKQQIKMERKLQILSEKTEDDIKAEGQALINKMFDTFKVGAGWLKSVQAEAKVSYKVQSPMGNVRHLWGYMHNERTVHGMMDRRGPNSLVQGLSSNLGYLGSRRIQKYRFQLQRLGFDLKYQHTNMVHDSNECESALITLPQSLYMLEHGLTTMVKKHVADVFDFHLMIDLEAEVQIGPSHAVMETWDYTVPGMIALVKKSMQWQKENMNYKFSNEDEILRKIKHNAKLMDKIRCQELMGKSKQLYLQPKQMAKLDLHWS